jgi:hypothetical protein
MVTTTGTKPKATLVIGADGQQYREVGPPAEYKQGDYVNRVTVSKPIRDTGYFQDIFVNVYVDDGFRAYSVGQVGQLLLAQGPGYWFELPTTITKKNSTGRNAFIEDMVLAPELSEQTTEEVETNVDDSYSLRDIVEFKSNVAVASIVGGNFEWLSENQLKLDTNTMFNFTPKSGWAAIMSIDGNELTVNERQTFTTMGRSDSDNIVSLVSLQRANTDGSVDVWTGSDETVTSGGSPFTYTGSYAWAGIETVEEWEGEPYGDYSHGWALRIRKYNENIETGESEYYLVQRVLPWDEDFTWFTIGPVDEDGERVQLTLSQAQELFESEKVNAVQSATEFGAQENIEQEGEKQGSVIWTEEIRTNSNHRYPNKFITYELTYVRAGTYRLDEEGLPFEVFKVDTDAKAITMAQEAAASLSQPPREGMSALTILIISGVVVAAVVGGIIWVRTREE